MGDPETVQVTTYEVGEPVRFVSKGVKITFYITLETGQRINFRLDGYEKASAIFKKFNLRYLSIRGDSSMGPMEVWDLPLAIPRRDINQLNVSAIRQPRFTNDTMLKLKQAITDCWIIKNETQNLT